MSASVANVPCGLTKQMPAATRNNPPKIAETQRMLPVSGMYRSAKFSTEANMNMRPTRMPTVVTEAESNWRITSEMRIQAIPANSHIHQ